MLNELSKKMQQAWLDRGISAIQPNDQMYLPAPQALLVQWTLDACKDTNTNPEHSYNLARYWFHGLRFPAQGARSRVQLENLLSENHLKEYALRAANTLLAGELMPLRIVRMWGFMHKVLPSSSLVPHLDRLLAAPLPTGKKLKLSQIVPENWSAWLLMRETLEPAPFKAGLELHVRANLISRQDVDPHERCIAAWEMLQGCESVLPLLDEQNELAGMKLSCLLSVIVQYADSQTLRHLPWVAIQERFVAEPTALQAVWMHLFEHHKHVLLSILPDVEEQFHPHLLQLFMGYPEFTVDESHLGSMVALVRKYTAWSSLFNQMLTSKDGYKRLGRYLVGSLHEQSTSHADQMSGEYLSRLTAQQWRQMLMYDGHPSYSAQQLFNIWELVRVHKLRTLAARPWLHRATLAAIPQSVLRLPKVSAWDVSLGLPPFYATLLQLYLKEDEQEAWFNDWMEKPSAEKMIVQAFQWFNPTIPVPPMGELTLLAQALSDNATVVDVLAHLGRKIEAVELPMLE